MKPHTQSYPTIDAREGGTRPHELAVACGGRFQIERKLGEGGMGAVYLARDRERGERVALKTLCRVEPRSLFRFKKEFRALAHTSHPNLVALHELVSEGERWFLSMEYVEGWQFLDYLRHVAPGRRADPGPAGVVLPARPTSQTFRLATPDGLRHLRDAFAQLAQGVQALHASGKLHRDLKPSNVLVSTEGRVVVLDFGMVDDPGNSSGCDSIDERQFGTPAYMAPEQAAGTGAVEASDWYSFGVMLHEALTGSLPFDGSVSDIVLDKQRKEPLPPSQRAGGVPADLDQLCSQLLSRSAAARPRASEILRRLARIPVSGSGRPRASWSAPEVLLGREVELATLGDAHDAVGNAGPVVVFVEGSAGVGKTALVRHFGASVAERDRAVVLHGRCFERESVPFKAVDNLVDSLCRWLSRRPATEVASYLPRNANALSRLFPVLHQVAAIERAPSRPGFGPGSTGLRAAGFDGLRELFARIADRNPLVLCVDDLQWSDVDSAILFEHLICSAEAPAALSIFTYRPTRNGDNPVVARLRGVGVALDGRRVSLGPLACDAALALAESRLRMLRTGTRGVAAQIARESAGSPFFLGELVESVIRPPRRGDVGPAPASLSGLLRARIEALPAGARRLLEVTAVATRPLPQGLALRVASIRAGGGALVNSLRVARLVCTHGARDQDAIECADARVREVVLELLDAESRRRIEAWLEPG